MLTLELRWFVPATVSDRQLRAFDDGGRFEARTDTYLLGTGDDLGIKRRGAAGLLEHKRRTARTPISVAHDPKPLVGVAERWLKTWPDGGATLAEDAGWAAIDKRRALRRIGRNRAELTLLRAAWLETPYLTLAVESADVDGLDSLLRIAATLLRTHPELAQLFEQAESWSCGYPTWLARLRPA